MPVVTIQRSAARVTLVSERLQVEVPERNGVTQRSQVPLAEIERLVVGEDVLISTPALCQLLQRGVPVCFLGYRGNLLGSFEPPGLPHVTARLRQYGISISSEPPVAFARALVEAKIANGRRILQRLEANHPRLSATELTELGAFLQSASTARTLEELRGHEGIAAQRFYASWSLFLPAEFPFEYRSRRPPHNPVNACLSYLATILYGELLSASYASGLDPALGCLHVAEDGRWALPLDLMEPFRPVIVESLTLRLFALHVLNTNHFTPQAEGIYLTNEGRRLLWQHYEQRLTREFFSEHAGHRTTLRHLILDAPAHFKTCLDRPELFRPFRLN